MPRLATERKLQLAKPHTGGQRALYLHYKHGARFQVVACGRRYGKTEFGKLLVAETTLEYGEDVWWISPTYKMSAATWREFRSKFGPYAKYTNAQDKIMEFNSGAALTFWTGDNAETMRGGAPYLVIIDEAAMIKNGGDIWHGIIRPTLTDKKGRVLFLSTPRGRGWFWDLFQLGNDKRYPEYKSWNFPSWFNPILDPDEIEEAKRTLPDRFFRQEYAAEFMDDAGGVFRHVIEASTAEYSIPRKGGRYIIGIDWAREHDYTVITVWDAERKIQVDLDRFTGVSYSLQRGRIVNMFNKWGAYVVWAEANSMGMPNIEALQMEGLPVRPFHMTVQSKGPLIEAYALAVERGQVMLLNDRVQIAEHQAYEMERRETYIRYSAPDGAFDDTVIANALCYHGLASSGEVLSFIEAA